VTALTAKMRRRKIRIFLNWCRVLSQKWEGSNSAVVWICDAGETKKIENEQAQKKGLDCQRSALYQCNILTKCRVSKCLVGLSCRSFCDSKWEAVWQRWFRAGCLQVSSQHNTVAVSCVLPTEPQSQQSRPDNLHVLDRRKLLEWGLPVPCREPDLRSSLQECKVNRNPWLPLKHLPTYLTAYFLNYLLNCLLHAAESFLRN
jgi:hypothetical protein